MPDDATEQLADGTSEQPVGETEQPQGDVAETTTPDVADPAGDVAEREVVDLASLLASDDGINQLLDDEQVGKVLKGRLEKEAKDAEFRTRQAVEKELRQRAASDEMLAERLKAVALEAGWDADDDRLRNAVAAFHAPADQRRTIEQSLTWIGLAREGFSDDGKAGIDLAVRTALEADDPQSALVSVVSQVYQGTRDAGAREAVQSLSLDAVPENAPLRKEIDAYVAKRVEEELQAAAISAGRVDPGPARSTGTAPGTNRDQEIDRILQTAPASSAQYREAFKEKHGFELAPAR